MNREIIKSKLPYGYTKIVASKAGVSITTVYKYLEGKCDNVKVEVTALEIIAELAETNKSLLERIKTATV